MTEFDLSVDAEKNRIYLKEEVAKILLTKNSSKIKARTAGKVVLMYPKNLDKNEISASLIVLENELSITK